MPEGRRRLIAIDLDGTPYGRGGAGAAANGRAIAAARAAGHRVVIATGRSWLESREARAALRDHVDDDDVLIGAGGAIVSRLADGRTLDRDRMDAESTTAVGRCLARHGHHVQLLQDPDRAQCDYLLVGDRLDPTLSWWLDRYGHRTRTLADLPTRPELDHTVRVGTVTTARELATVVAELRRDLGDRLTIHHWHAVGPPDGRDRPELVEVFAPGTSKWRAIERLCGRWRIDPADTVAIGDGLNDLEMIDAAGLGIAVENADDRVLEVADRRVAAHDRDGVAEAISAVLDGRW
ncbi:MAG: HAD hydrolase family protein [Phycisphaerales bacterium]